MAIELSLQNQDSEEKAAEPVHRGEEIDAAFLAKGNPSPECLKNMIRILPSSDVDETTYYTTTTTTTDEHEELLGACGGIPSDTIQRQTIQETNIDSPLAEIAPHKGSSELPAYPESTTPVSGNDTPNYEAPPPQTLMESDLDLNVPSINSFGIIKDLSVNNIISSEEDKTSEFENKDFSLFYVKSPSEREKEMVFEPRPSEEIEEEGAHSYRPPGEGSKHKKKGHKQKKSSGDTGSKHNKSDVKTKVNQTGAHAQRINTHFGNKNTHESMARVLDSGKETVGPNTILFRAKKTPEQIELKETHTSNVVEILKAAPQQGKTLAPMASIETLDQQNYDSDSMQGLSSHTDSEIDIDLISVSAPLLAEQPFRLNNEVRPTEHRHIASPGSSTDQSEGEKDDPSAVYV